MIFPLEDDSAAKSKRFFCDRENSATSDAATIAQQNSKITIPIIPNSKLVSRVSKKRKLGSGSKLEILVKQY